MTSTIIGEFETRRGAELAIERIVQELGIARDDVTVRPVGDENSAGTKTAGSDAKTMPAPEGREKLEGLVEVLVKSGSAGSQSIVDAMKTAGSVNVRGA